MPCGRCASVTSRLKEGGHEARVPSPLPLPSSTERSSPPRRRRRQPRAGLCRAPQRRHCCAQAIGDEQREATVAGQRPRRERREQSRPNFRHVAIARQRWRAVLVRHATHAAAKRRASRAAPSPRATRDAQRNGARGGIGVSSAECAQRERVAA